MGCGDKPCRFYLEADPYEYHDLAKKVRYEMRGGDNDSQARRNAETRC